MVSSWKRAAGFCSIVALLGGVAMPAQGASVREGKAYQGFRELQSEQPTQRSTQEKWNKISGTVERMKHVGLRGTDQQNLVVLLRANNKQRVVDLGDARKLQRLNIHQGDSLKAWGRILTIGEHRVFMAHGVKAHGERITIDRKRAFTRASGNSGERRGVYAEDQQPAFSQGSQQWRSRYPESMRD